MHDQLAIEDLFTAALEIPRRERFSLVQQATLSESDRQAVLRLLHAHEQGSMLLNDSIFADLERIDAGFLDNLLEEEEESPSFPAGTDIDIYKVVEEVGRGGMSIVYKAQQSDPIDRTVALKVIRPHLLSPQALRRFIREQQALAIVSHPNIATLFSVGTTDNGQPYAAMEFVDGPPIDVFCDMHRLTVDQRLSVFRQVCVALQHAHENGVVHRDVKPNNILVFVEQKSPRVKLIDFGIAKLLEGGSREETNVTRFGQLVGSPRYMSPEQLGGHTVAATTDVYSAGLVLFELVTGSPFRQSDDLLAISKSLTDEPQLASSRIRESVAAGDSVAEFRSTTAGPLIRRVKKDIDWILSKALASRIEDRYATIDDLLTDINAAIAGKPIAAAGPSLGRQVKTFVESHKLLIMSTIASATLLLEFTAFAYWYNGNSSPPRTIHLQPVLYSQDASDATSTESPLVGPPAERTRIQPIHKRPAPANR